jgi:multiple antibiotic resistance protein
MDLSSKIISISFTLFLLMDSIGNVPLFVSLLKNFPTPHQRKIIARELFIALAVIIGFSFVGNYLFDFIEIKTHTLLIAGGIILFLIALHMIFPPENPLPKESQIKDPFIVPLAVPLVAGPAVLAAVTIYSEQEGFLVTTLSIVIAWIASTAILLSSTYLKRFLGDRGLLACEKLMGLLLTLLAIQMCLKGMTLYICELKTLLTP